MNPNTQIFVLWLQGYLDANKAETLNSEQLSEIKSQLKDVVETIKNPAQNQNFPGMPFFPGQHGMFPGQFGNFQPPQG